MTTTPTAAPSSDHTHALPTSATPTSTTGPDAAERSAGLVAPLYLRGLVQSFATDNALVKTIAKFTGMNRKQSASLAAALAALRADGVAVARLQGLALATAPGFPTIIMTLPDGKPGLGIAFTDEEPAALADVLAACEAEAGDLQPGFVLVAIPAGVVAGGLQ